MKTKIKISIALIGLFFGILNNSCTKEETVNPTSPVKITTSNAVAEFAFADLNKQAKNAIIESENEMEGKKGIKSTCATITISPFDLTTFPKEIEIDFGQGCMGDDGVFRKGIVNIHTTGWYREEGTVITVTTDNYSANGIEIDGLEVMTNNGRNQNDNLFYTIYIDGTATSTEGTIYWESERENEWIAGETSILNPWDDEYLITGWQKGTSVEGDEYQIDIIEALHLKINCSHIVSGKLKLISDNLQSEVIIDYGIGECDNIATATYMGQTYTIVMQ